MGHDLAYWESVAKAASVEWRLAFWETKRGWGWVWRHGGAKMDFPGSADTPTKAVALIFCLEALPVLDFTP